jgi:hypothetical protein
VGAGLADRCPDGSALVAAEVVHDHDVARMQSGHQGIFDIGTELNAVDRAIEEDGSCDAVLSKCCQEGQRSPLAEGRLGEKSLPASTPPTGRRHVGLGPGFVDEHQARRIEFALVTPPAFTPPFDVGTVLFACE